MADKICDYKTTDETANLHVGPSWCLLDSSTAWHDTLLRGEAEV